LGTVSVWEVLVGWENQLLHRDRAPQEARGTGAGYWHCGSGVAARQTLATGQARRQGIAVAKALRAVPPSEVAFAVNLGPPHTTTSCSS
jgi:hypothetical protein